MTERYGIEALERRYGDRIRAYSDTGTTRSVDPVDVARAAMAAQRPASWRTRRFRLGFPERRTALVGAAVLVAALVVWGVIVGVQPRETVGQSSTPASGSPGPTGSVSGALPDALRHPWQRPIPIAPPGSDPFASGYLAFADDELQFGSAPAIVISASRITFVGVDSVVLTATEKSAGCAVGSVGNYGWALQGKETAMTLTPIGADACLERAAQIGGFWVRADLAGPGQGEAAVPAGEHASVSFDVYGEPSRAGQFSYTVPAGWGIQDTRAAFGLHRIPDPSSSPSPIESAIFVIPQPRMAAPFEAGASCEGITDAPGVGTGIDDLVAAIRARREVISSTPSAITIDGHGGQMLDLRLATVSAGTCETPGGPAAVAPILHQGLSVPEPGVILTPDRPVRLILLDVGGGRTIAIAIFSPGPIAPSSFDQVAAQAMPIIESFKFHRPSP